MKSSWLTQLSAFLLLTGGLGLLFLPDAILPAVHPGYPASAAWLGQLAASGWLAIAGANWLQRRAVIGGIYHRPLVFANLIVYFVTGASLIPAVVAGTASVGLAATMVVGLVMAAAYAYALRKGPLPGEQA